MTFADTMRHGAWIFFATSVGVAALATTSSVVTACGDSASCIKLRSDTLAKRRMWSACNPSDFEPCIEVFGNPKDCSGVLSCSFAVNPHFQIEAQDEVVAIPNESQGCYSCSAPICSSGEIPYCEPISRQCILITGLIDGSIQQGPMGDGGGITPMPAPTSTTPTPTSVPDASGE